MKKISTLYKKDPNDLGRVINEVNPENEWVFTSGIPTRKYDGTACAIINGMLYKRYDCKINKETGKYKKPIPEGAIPCQEADKITGHHPHWIKCERDNPADKYHFQAWDKNRSLPDGTFELCGPKINGNHEKFSMHLLIRHGMAHLQLRDYTFESVKKYLEKCEFEGIVFHDRESSKMCKIRKSDFGFKR